MQRAYRATTDLDGPYQSAHRVASVGSLHDRALPYGYQYCRYEPRPDFFSRQSSYSLIQEPDHGSNATQSRRRIAVACARCRRRKIRCSGDPGDKSGCNACKSSGSDITKCVFNRVGSQTIDLQLPSDAANTTACSAANSQPALGTESHSIPITQYEEPGFRQRILDHRTSLPTLYTRMPLSKDTSSQYCDPHYDCYDPQSASSLHNPVSMEVFNAEDSYRWYGSNPVSQPARHDSLASTVVDHNHPAMYHYSNLPVLPDNTSESLSTMNMNPLGSSLPAQPPVERRLPAPYNTVPLAHVKKHTQSNTRPYSRTDESTVSFRSVGIHDRMALPWVYGRENTGKTSTHSSGNSATGQAVVSQQPSMQVTPSVSEPAFGYQFHPLATYSPDVSPTAGPELAESFAGLSTNGHAMSGHDRILAGCSMPTQTGPVAATSLASHRQSSETQAFANALCALGSTETTECNSQAHSLGHKDMDYSYGNERSSANRHYRHHNNQQQRPSYELTKRHHSLDYPPSSSAHIVSGSTMAGRL